MNELTLKTSFEPTHENPLPEIRVNDEEIAKKLEWHLKKYSEIKLTENTLRDGKETRAELNRLLKAVDDRRKSVKKEWMVPLTNFEAKMKRLSEMIAKPIKTIDDQIRVFEDERRDEKVQFAKSIHESIIEGNPESSFVTFEMVDQPDFRNLTKKESDIQKDIAETIQAIMKDLETLKMIESPFSFEMIDHFKRHLDVGAAIAEGQRLKDQQERKQAAEAARLAEAKKTTTSETTDFRGGTPILKGETTKEETLSISFKATGTREQLRALADFVKFNGIKLERI